MALRYTQASPLFSLLWQSALEFSVSFTGHLKRVERSTSRWRTFHSHSSDCAINDEVQGMAGDGEGAYTAASNYLRTPTATSGLACHFTLPPSVSVLVQGIKNWARRRGLWLKEVALGWNRLVMKHTIFRLAWSPGCGFWRCRLRYAFQVTEKF